MSLIADGIQLQRPLEGLNLSLARAGGRITPPPARAITSIVAGRHGRRPEPSLSDTRVVPLSGWITQSDPDLLVEELDRLKALFNPARDPWLLRDTLPNGVERWIYVRGSNVMGAYRNPHTFDLDVELEADDPFWYSAYGTLNLDAGVEMDDDELMDAGGEIVVTPPATEVTFDAIGNTDVERIRIRFVGPSGGSVGVENLSTSELVGFTSTEVLAAGDRITVNNYHRTARRDQGASLGSVRGAMTLREGNRHGEYLRLIPGSNVLRILGAPAEARIMFFPTWL